MTPTEWEEVLYPTLIDNIQTIIDHIPDDGVLFDVGANVGLITEHVLKAKPNVTAWLFEPLQSLYEHCVEKFKDYPNVHVSNLGLSDYRKYAKIIKDDHNLGHNRVEETNDKEGNVKLTTLFLFANIHNIQHIDFVKIDTEGHDVKVLEGMKYFLQTTKKKPVILFEIWVRDEIDSVVEKMKQEYGYTATYFDNDILLTIK